MKTYCETKSFKIAQARHRRKFNLNTLPNGSQIFKLVKNFEAHGTCEHRRVTDSSPTRPPTMSLGIIVSRVQESVVRSPSKYLRGRTNKVGISVSSGLRILIKDLELYPYWIQIQHQLTETDVKKRVAMCQ